MPGELPQFGGVLTVAGALQGASTPSEITGAYLDSIPGAVSAAGYGFYILDPASMRPVDVAATVPDEFLDLYEQEGRRDDPVLEEAVETGAPIDSSRLSPQRSWDSSAVAGVLAGAGYYHSLEAPIIVDGVVQGTLNMARLRSDDPFSRRDLTTVGMVAEHVGLALTRSRRFEKLADDTLLLADALDAASQPIVITTVEGDLIFSNRLATKPAPGSPRSYLERAQPVLAEALALLRDGAKRIVTAHETPTGHDGTGGGDPGHEVSRTEGIVAVKAVRLRTRADAVVSFLHHRQVAPGLPDAVTLLSKREQEIADLVSRGLTTRQIAELSYVSENTVKQHLKRIFAKLQVRSRAELVQAVWQAAAGDTGSRVGREPEEA